jgi:hypothetical protein
MRAAAGGGVGLALAWAGCGKSISSRPSSSGSVSSGSQTAAGTPKPGGTYLQSLTNSPPSLDAHQTSSTHSMAIQGWVLSRLFRFRTAADPSVS